MFAKITLIGVSVCAAASLAHHALAQNFPAKPLRIVVPGRTYRSDSDATHTPMFHQMEGLVIDKAIHMGHLTWTLETFTSRFFETPLVGTPFRPHHFPFTQPSPGTDAR